MALKSKKKWLVLVLIAGIIGIPVVVKSNTREAGREVETDKVVMRTIHPTILASGTLAFGTEVDLRSELTAKVADILVKEGDMVDKGQVLIKLEPENYRNAIDFNEAGLRQARLDIEQKKASLELQRREFDRTKRLYEAKMIDGSKYDNAKSQLTLAEVALKSSEEAILRSDSALKDARKNLARTEIRAPIAGRVVALPIKIGETAIPSMQSMAGAQLLTIADTTAIKAELKVDEGDISHVSLGQSVEIFAAAYANKPLTGKVSTIALAPIINPTQTSRAYKVTVMLEPGKEVQLRSGMSCRAEIMLGNDEKKLAVPVEAVMQEEKSGQKQPETYVWIASGGKAEKRVVKTGLADDRWQAIETGLKADEQVIAGPGKSLRELKAGDAVKTKPREVGKSDKSGVTVQVSSAATTGHSA
ncbi:efflux RND transporter periplasmic adaptor subunit [Burkholderiaceae bacterium DAT-1]|nr:efflux RND transporter periplasmic adaptor subunit [Burkholderiaceae bacterium DAT-1]